MSKPADDIEANLILVDKSYFSITFAVNIDRYELWQERRNWRGKIVQEPVREYFGVYSTPVSGDLEWVRRIAKHYKIDMPSKEK